MSNKTRKIKTITRGTLTALTIMAAINPVFGGITGSDVVNSDGTVTYSFIVDNSAGRFDVAAWSLEFGFLLPDWNQLDNFSGGNVTVPNSGWFADVGTPITGQSAQDFISLDPGSDVAAGDILDGFSFTSKFQPGTITYEEFSADGTAIMGTTIGPVNQVPEGNGLLAAIAFFSIAGFAAATRVSRAKNGVTTSN